MFFKCRYASSVGVRADDGAVGSNHVIHNDVVGKGSFVDSFELDVFGNDKFRHETEVEKILIGRMVYAEIEWKLYSLYNKQRF